MESLTFSGHETFPFRYGWLKKGVDAVASFDSKKFFSNSDAMIRLGVGKNMVQSIRHWCVVSGLIESSGKAGEYELTDFGRKLFSETGYDPFLEDPASLWLLHWRIATNRSGATSWYWLFNEWHSVEFTKAQMTEEIGRWIERNELRPIASNTLLRDIDTVIRTYVHASSLKGAVYEDSFSCPLTELNLIYEIEQGKAFKIARGEQKSLPNEIFLYGLVEYWEKNCRGLNSLSLEKIAYEPGSPGKVFKLDRESIAMRLEVVANTENSSFTFEEKNGLKQIYRHSKLDHNELLDNYYADRN